VASFETIVNLYQVDKVWVSLMYKYRSCHEPFLEIDFQKRARYPPLQTAFLAMRSWGGYHTPLEIGFQPPLKNVFVVFRLLLSMWQFE